MLSSPFLPQTLISSSCHRSFISIHNLSYGLIKKGWSGFRCSSVGGGETTGGVWFDGGSLKGSDNGSIVEGFDRAGSSFSTLNAEITQETVDFFVSDAEGDPDQPSEGFCSIDLAIHALREGKFVIAVDDEDDEGENEGDLIMAATLASTEAIAFMIRNGSGIISVGMKEDDLERLMIPMMSPITEIKDLSATAATITVDARITSSGLSAADRAKTILALASPDSKPGDFRRPGHVFPLKYRNGGVLKRAGHTEASVDLVTLAGLRPVSVLSTIIDPEDGSLAGLPALHMMAKEYNLPIISISDLIRYRRKREKLVEKIAVSRLPTKWGLFQAYCYQSRLDGTEHIAVVKVQSLFKFIGFCNFQLWSLSAFGKKINRVFTGYNIKVILY
ncbi:putative monofunctional riboflavin biosynthesis protein RIBA 3 [Canna indica]|uniref:Monofunctional riboflavin biosynthesis protein RIBA 3 n=1 Tax=Canna indica TaxID=4628 RepID=A0AAQ3JSM0_9LILI|nr:putative monofunctional riboflavin biosynthesis protein RIBA 3 [Canna indica]